MSVPEIVTGDSTSLAVTLRKNGAVFAIDPAAEVKAALVSKDHKTAYTAEPIEQSNAAPGADWPHSLVIVELPPSSTNDIAYQGLALLEIQVSENASPKTWFVLVNIVTGQIP
ncbi:MAG: hypothetical protein ACOYB1_18605 [Limnohabitans sp.]